VKARVALDQDPGGQLIIGRPDTRNAFVVLDSLPVSLSADVAQLAADETEHWAAAKRGSRKGPSSRASTVASFPSIFASVPLITDPIEPGDWPTMASYSSTVFSGGSRLEPDESSWRALYRSKPRDRTGWLTLTASKRPTRRVPPRPNSRCEWRQT
jgi:hypothetical protein